MHVCVDTYRPYVLYVSIEDEARHRLVTSSILDVFPFVKQ